MTDDTWNAISGTALILTVLFFAIGGGLVCTDTNAPITPASDPAPIYSVGDTLVIELDGIREIKPIHDNNQNKFK